MNLDDGHKIIFLRVVVFYTVSQKVPTFKLSVTLSNLSRFSKRLHCWKAYEICYKNPHNITHLTVGMLLHYLGILEIQIFCKYSTDVENANKLHFQCTNFNSSTCVTVYAECICVFIKILSLSLNATLIVDKHCGDVCCDKFPIPQTDHKSKQVKEQGIENFICNQVWENSLCWHLKYQNLWMNNKVRSNKMQFVCIFPHLPNICRKFEFLISQGSVATCLRRGG